MSRPLPTDREKALEAIANGWGRDATTAHPDCTCLVPVKVVGENDTPKTVQLPTRDSRRACPVHRGTP